MGPLLIFDKSFLQMLSPDEMEELAMNFKLVITPILISEITADLRLPPEKKVIPENVVRSLAAKMRRNNGVTNAHFRLLGIGEMNQLFPISLIGQAIVDSAASNVHITQDGKGLVYDGIPEQRMWEAWSKGEFSEAAFEYAEKWRDQIPQIDVPGIKTNWDDFVKRFMAGAKTIDDVIARIDGQIINNASSEEQRNLLFMIWHFLEMSEEASLFSLRMWRDGLVPLMRDVFPYATSIARIAMTFCSALRLNLVTSKPTNILDLQYLFYAPFAMIFVSKDRLHRQLWNTVVGKNDFVWGEELKADLRAHVEARGSTIDGPQPPREPYFKRFSTEQSVIERMRAKYLAFDTRLRQSAKKTEVVEELDPEIQERLQEAFKILDNAKES